MRAHEIISMTTEHVNDRLFYTGYEKKKPILSGRYVLTASAGYVGYGARPDYKSSQFRIVAATNSGEKIGWVNFENKNDKLEALDLSIQPAHRRLGIATEMYKFARELGNDIAPSRLQTGMGRLFWTKDHSRDIDENFADGKHPEDKGDSLRYGIPKHASLAQLDKIGHGSGRRAQLARWQANMRRGRAK